jgi:transposase
VQAVLLRKRGIPRKEIVAITGRSFDSVEDWIIAYNKDGIQGLMTKKLQKKNASKLTEGQRHEITHILNTHTPKGMKLSDQDYWDIPTLTQLVQTYGVTYRSRASYTKLFHDCGYSYQRVEFVDTRRNTDDGENFKKKYSLKSKEGGIVMSW